MQSPTQPLNPHLLRQLATIAAIVGTFLVNVLSNFYPLKGLSIGEISNTVFAEVLLTPASYAFAIWGLIYLGLFALGIYQLLPAQRQNPTLRRIGYLLVWACIAQAIWVVVFLSRWFLFSLVAMVAILVPLIGIYLRLGPDRQHSSRQEKWFLHRPISVYLGWITVATVLNVALALYDLNWNGWGIAPSVWTAITMVVSTTIATLAAIQRQDVAYTLVIVWALVAIAVKHQLVPLIAITGMVAGISLVVLSLFILSKGDDSNRL